MKKILIGLLVILTMAAKSQCASATTLATNGSWLGNTTFTTSDKWHKFTTAQDNYRIKIYIQSYNSTKHTVTLYSGSCISPTMVTTTTLISGGDSLELDVNSLSVSSTYYLKLGNGLTPTSETYNINVYSIAQASVPLSGCTNTDCGYPTSSLTCGTELVCNGGFECMDQFNPIVIGPGELNFATNWQPATNGTPDLLSAGAGFVEWSTPCNAFGDETPPNNGANNYNYAGIIVAVSGGTTVPIYCEYIETKLISALQLNKKYIISFDVSMAERSQVMIDQISIFLTSSQIYQNTLGPITTSPKATFASTATLNNMSGWTRLSFCYTPTVSTEQYLTIGYGGPGPSLASVSPINSVCPTYTSQLIDYTNLAYMFIDEVSVKELNLDNLTYSVCPNVPLAIQGTTCLPNSNFNFTWNPGTGLSSTSVYNPTVTIGTSQNYTVNLTAVDITGATCSANNSGVVTVTVLPIPSLTISASSSSVCPGQSSTLSTTSGYSSYSWSPGSYTTATVAVTPTATTIYTVIVTNSLGCTNQATVQVSYPVPANFSFAPTPSPAVICTNLGQSSTTLTASSNATATTYTWNPGALTGSLQVVTPTVNTTYTLTASIAGCSFTQTMGIAISSVCCSSTVTPFNSLVFSPNTTYTNPLVFNADVTVTPGSGVWLSQSYFLFAPGVKITVPPGSSFNLEGAHLYACGSTMWKGIVVQDGGSVHSFSTVNISLVTIHNLVEDAETAIDASSQSTSTLNAIIDCRHTTFNKNYIDIKFDGYQQTNSSYPFLLRECVFTCRSLTYSPTSWPRTLTTELRSAANPTTGLASPYDLMGFATTTLLAPYSGSISNTALYLNNVGTTSGGTYYAVSVGSTSAVGDFNLFDGHVYGIKAINSNVESLNNAFQNGNTSNSYPAGVAISHSVGTSANMKLNLYAGSTNPSLGNRFWNWPTAVAVANTYSFNCQYATFRSTQNNTVTPSAYNAGNYGIFSLSNRFNYEISNNNFNNINTGYRMMVLPGVYATGGGTAYGVYANNIDMQNNFFGAQLTSTTSISNQYMNQAVMISSAINYTWNNVANTGLYINSNTIDRAYRGINVTGLRNYLGNVVNNTIKLVDDNLYNAPQKGIYIANNMLNVLVSTNTLQASGTTNTLVSLVSSGLGANHLVTCNDLRNANRGFEFTGNQPGAIWKGNSMQPMPIGYALITGGVIGTQGGTTSPIDNSWNSTWTGYSQTYVDMTSDAQFSKIWVQNSGIYNPSLNTGPVGQYYAAPGNINTTTGTYSCGGGGAPPNIIVPNTSSLSNGMGHIANDVLYRYLYLNPDSINGSSTLQSFVNSYSLTSLDYFMQIEAALYNNDPSTASSLLSSVTATNPVETNSKIFYQLFIDYLNNSFDATDSTTLHDMIGDCPGIYGSWVYQARSLYDQIYNLTSPTEPDCLDQPSAGRANPAANNNPGISTVTHDVTLPLRYNPQNVTAIDQWKADIYPNPAKNELYVGSSWNNEYVNIRIEDVQGRILRNEIVKIDNYSVRLQIDLQSGIYFVTLTNSRKESVSQKLLISK